MLPDAIKQSRNFSGPGFVGGGSGSGRFLDVWTAGVLVVLVQEEVRQQGGAGNASVLRTDSIKLEWTCKEAI